MQLISAHSYKESQVARSHHVADHEIVLIMLIVEQTGIFRLTLAVNRPRLKSERTFRTIRVANQLDAEPPAFIAPGPIVTLHDHDVASIPKEYGRVDGNISEGLIYRWFYHGLLSTDKRAFGPLGDGDTDALGVSDGLPVPCLIAQPLVSWKRIRVHRLELADELIRYVVKTNFAFGLDCV